MTDALNSSETTESNDLKSSREILAEVFKSSEAGKAQPAEKQDVSNDDTSKPKSKVKPKDLKHAAEMLGVEVKDLYDLEVSYGDGASAKKRKLGELKDLAVQQDDFTVRSLKLDEDRRAQEAEFARAEQMLKSYLQELPPNLRDPKVMQRMEQRFQENAAKQRELIMANTPEWQDAAVRETEIKGMIEFLKDYGLNENYLAANPDHRVFKLVRDMWQQTTKLRAALAQVTERKPAASKSSNVKTAKSPQKGPALDGYSRKVNSLMEQINGINSR